MVKSYYSGFFKLQTQRDFLAIMIKYIVLLLISVVAAQAFACPPNVCNYMPCGNLDDCDVNNGYKIREHGGVCQCCDICVQILGENENCIPPSELVGVIITSECDSGLLCDPESHVCRRSNSLPLE
ncbi:uncharacterized protein CDAR_48011 [Caerostris darwini]|uniref:Uncharacterized protein n=1 Tax=Caerostris darwini TaxID=1538125 RepID=A0AAV4W1K3_9ARAC|nr:uncharacterized protein CDAR_48011 [Caerostris darwini]